MERCTCTLACEPRGITAEQECRESASCREPDALEIEMEVVRMEREHAERVQRTQ